MKSIKEIVTILLYELDSHLDKIESVSQNKVYYNDILGNTSFLLAGLLELILRKKFSDWDKKKWMDDSLITEIIIQSNNLTIGGIMIWGTENTTEQWTDPFSFKIELHKDEMNYRNFTFLFCDLDNHEISYDEFRVNRDYWDKSSRNWKYVIDSDKSL